LSLRHQAQAIRNRLMEGIYGRGGETAEHVTPAGTEFTSGDYHAYEPSGWRQLRRGLRGLPAGREDTFVDVGCGKGRVLAQAVRHPFRRVLGVEYSPELAEHARRLVEAQRDQWKAGDVEIITADATQWAVPEDVTVVYAYNVLHGDAFRSQLDRLADSVERAPRTMWFVYANPEHEQVVLEHPAFELWKRRGRRKWWQNDDPRRVSVFRVTAPKG
jgi:SAM-dependent methyltransferase